MTSISLIPGLCPDVNFPIFSYLHPVNLGIGCLVSRTWNQFCSADLLWKQFPELTLYWNQDIKTAVDLHAVGSYADVAREFEKFTNQLKSEGTIPRWEGSFRCLFPYNPEYQIHIELGYGNLDFLNKKPTDTCTRLFMKPFGNNTSDFSDAENSQEVSSHGTLLNPSKKYVGKQFTVNISKSDAAHLSLKISDIANRCIERLKPVAGQKANRHIIFMISSAICFVFILFMATKFKPDSH